MLKECLENVREKHLLIHSITNYVTANDVANCILASGAKPIMADEKDEVEEITALSSGLCLNLGTLQKSKISSMKIAGKKAKSLQHPVLLDPVGVGGSLLRTTTALDLLHEVHPEVIRGNISEIKALFLERGNDSGVDASQFDFVSEENLNESVAFLKQCAHLYGGIIVASGAIDLVSDGNVCYVIRNGRKEMAYVTGTGCQLSGLITAFVASNMEHVVESVVAAVCTMGIAGEIGYQHLAEFEGNATYRNRIIDAIYHMDGMMLERNAKYEIR